MSSFPHKSPSNPAIGDMERDLEMELVLEFSKKTFAEEEMRRKSERAETDLIMIEDPGAVQRRDTINRIKSLCNDPPNVAHRTPQLGLSRSQVSPPPIPTSYSFNEPFYARQQQEFAFHFPSSLIQNAQPSTSAHELAVSQRNGAVEMGLSRGEVANSISCSLAADFSTPQLATSRNAKFRSNSLSSSKPLIDLHDFDPLLVPMNSKNNSNALFDVDPVVEETPLETNDFGDNFNLLKNVNFSNDPNATSYLVFDKLLQMIPQFGSNYSAEAKKLGEYTSRIAFSDNADPSEALFSALNVDYCTTKAESIKLVVFEDGTWPQDHTEFPRKIMFTCNIDKKCSDVLVEVLSELLPPEFVNTGELPLNDYGLRIYGYDEFLNSECTLGSFLFVGNAVAFDQDVKLQVGKRTLNVNRTSTPFKLLESPKSMLLTMQNFEDYVRNILQYINSLAKEMDYKIWSQVLELIKLLKSSMNQTLMREITLAVEAINAATSKKGYEVGVSNFASAIIRQLFAYSQASSTNFSIQTNALQLPGQKFKSMPIEEASGNFKFTIESVNNPFKQWAQLYCQFYMQVEVVHGKMSYPLVSTEHKSMKTSNHNIIVFDETIEIPTLISAMPQNISLSFVLLGVSFAIMPSGKRKSSQFEDVRLASGVLPLFDRNGMMLQGPTMLALSEINNGRIFPWGPRRLIYQPADSVLLVHFPEYEHEIVFPSTIHTSQFVAFDYGRLSEEDRLCIEWLIQHRFELHNDYKNLLWSKRAYLTRLPLALPLVLVSAFAWDSVSVANIYVLLDVWAELEPEDALELLLPCFADSRIRAKALEWIGKGTSAQLFSFIPQLLEALRYEQYEDSPIARFLLLQATKNRLFAFELYWQLNQRLIVQDDLRFRLRYKLMQDQLLKLNIPGFYNDLSYQHVFLDKLDHAYKRSKTYNEMSLMNDALRHNLNVMVEQFQICRLRLPLCPSFLCKELTVDRARFFNSAAKPIALRFAADNTEYSVMYKVGDDLRQDAVVMQLVTLINNLWNKANLDMRMITFKCLLTGRNKGLVEKVPDCLTLREIQVPSGIQGVFDPKVLNNWIKSNNQSEFLYKQAAENFRKSCAGWSVVSYVLGLADRHNDNIMLCKSGHLFHIDFGKYFGDVQMAGSIKRDRVPFVITQEMVNAINQGGMETTEFFQKFIDEICSAFQCLRKQASVIVNTMRLMTTSGIPGLNENAVAFVEDKLMLNESDDDAGLLLTTKIVESVESVYPRINFIAHTLAQGKGNVWELLFGNSVKDFDHMPFNLEDCSKETDGEIDNVYIQGFQKTRDTHDNTKVYLYNCRVKRKNMAEDPLISRTYDDFRNLYLRLCCKFPNIGIPSLGRSRLLVRSNVQRVANERFIELQHFVQTLFILPSEISHCNLVYNFFHHTLRDSEMHGDGSAEPSHVARAELDLRLILNPNQFTFRIIVGHARNIQLGANNESYVKVYLRTRDGLIVGGGKKKTDAARGNNPTYNKELCYSLSPVEMSEIFSYVLHVSIWQRTGSIVSDNFALFETVIVLSCLQEVKPNLDKVVEMRGNHLMFAASRSSK